MLILLLCEVGKKAPLLTYNISNIVKQQSFQENIKMQIVHIWEQNLHCQNLSHTLKEPDKCFRIFL